MESMTQPSSECSRILLVMRKLALDLATSGPARRKAMILSESGSMMEASM